VVVGHVGRTMADCTVALLPEASVPVTLTWKGVHWVDSRLDRSIVATCAWKCGTAIQTNMSVLVRVSETLSQGVEATEADQQKRHQSQAVTTSLCTAAEG
jgi:hypothetical protein